MRLLSRGWSESLIAARKDRNLTIPNHLVAGTFFRAIWRRIQALFLTLTHVSLMLGEKLISEVNSLAFFLDRRLSLILEFIIDDWRD